MAADPAPKKVSGGEQLLQIALNPKRVIITVTAFAALSAVVFLTGCGKSGTDATMGAIPTGAPASAPHTAASGPAVNDKLSLDQLRLDSPITTETDKNGLKFLHFKFTDNEGKVYECKLPEAMSKGQYTAPEWLSTFNVYKLPKVLAQKHVNKTEDLNDFPFISPKPQQQQAQEQQPQAQSAPNIPTPTLPTLPASSTPGGPPPIVSPGAAPGAPLPPGARPAPP